jgi:FKBP-type peptidyl-prolyl cis-trans isomerase FkpA
VTELKKIDTTLGTGAEATPGKHVSVHYTGWLFDAAAAANSHTATTTCPAASCLNNLAN